MDVSQGYCDLLIWDGSLISFRTSIMRKLGHTEASQNKLSFSEKLFSIRWNIITVNILNNVTYYQVEGFNKTHRQIIRKCTF